MILFNFNIFIKNVKVCWKKRKSFKFGKKKKKLHENQSIKASQQYLKLLNWRNKNIIECVQILWISK